MNRYQLNTKRNEYNDITVLLLDESLDPEDYITLQEIVKEEIARGENKSVIPGYYTDANGRQADVIILYKN